MNKNKKVAIIGSGPAGLTAAIYLSRASVETYVFLGNSPGGQLTQTSDIENYPGFENGINGGELMSNMMKQAQRFGAKLIHKKVDHIKKIDNGVIVKHSDIEEEFDAIILATGSTPKYIGIKDESKWLGQGYHTCATCDGFFYKGKDVAVVGGGDTAMEEASYLSNLANKVYIIHRSDNFKASKIMLDKCKSISNIEFLTNYQIVGFATSGDIFGGVYLLPTNNIKNKRRLIVDALFVTVGHTPNSELANGIITTDQFGYLLPKYRTMSEVEGIFIAGDVGDNIYRQAITAAGDGCKAAIDCERWLMK